MTARDFAYWLQGYFELQQGICENEGFSAYQAKLIRDHLKLVFIHDIDPSAGPPDHQAKLNEAHASNKEAPKFMPPQSPFGPKIRC
jgi:hypothetical protein